MALPAPISARWTGFTRVQTPCTPPERRFSTAQFTAPTFDSRTASITRSKLPSPSKSSINEVKEFSARSSRLGNIQAAQGETRKETPKTPPILPGETRGRECASRRPWSRTFGGAASIGSQRCFTVARRRGDRVD